MCVVSGQTQSGNCIPLPYVYKNGARTPYIHAYIHAYMQDMDLRIGTVSHSLLHIKMAQEHLKSDDREKDADKSDEDD